MTTIIGNETTRIKCIYKGVKLTVVGSSLSNAISFLIGLRSLSHRYHRSMENTFSWFSNHNVEAEVVGCGTPLHSLLVEDHNPGDKSCITGKRT
jgi:hypothetical protein